MSDWDYADEFESSVSPHLFSVAVGKIYVMFNEMEMKIDEKLLTKLQTNSKTKFFPKILKSAF